MGILKSSLPNISASDLDLIAARKNFKYEDTFDNQSEALAAARKRSLKSLRVIYTCTNGNKFTNHAHGISKVDEVLVARHHKGIRL